MQVFLIRHPVPAIAPGICYGQLDVPALEVEAAAAALRTQIDSRHPLFSSPLQRCRALAEALHPAPRFDERLMEMHFGDWEGQAWEAIDRRALDAWAADLLHHVPPGGESAATLQSRTVACLDAIAGEGHAACVVVTHAGAMRAALGHARGLPAEEWSQLKFAYGACVSVQWPGER
mgnify:CR=1 FL=1